MYARMLEFSDNHSFFLFGPRGTGKTTWLKQNYPKALSFDMLNARIASDFLADPTRLEAQIPKNFNDFIIIDEVQRVPELLNEVHRLIEKYKYKFILTGSSARKIRRGGYNLLAGRAIPHYFHPLTSIELGNDFNLNKYLQYGGLPSISSFSDPKDYLYGYINTYLEEEVKAEGLTRNLSAFARFMEIASFSQGSLVNISEIAREVMVKRKVVENYFSILEDLLIGYRIQVFSKKAKRRLVKQSKFYYFDVGVFNILRQKNPYDRYEEIEGIALETFFFQELLALNDYLKLRYKIYYFRTSDGSEVDFIAYGEKGFHAFEIKHSKDIFPRHLKGLRAFAKDYPEAKLHIFYLGSHKMYFDNIIAYPFEEGLKNLSSILSG